MATNFPTSLQDLDATRGSSSQALNNPSHATHHALEDDTIEAIQTKLGVDNSAVTSSIDYLLKSTLSVSPGHKHVSAEITDLVPISSSTGVADANKLIKTNSNGVLDETISQRVKIETFTSDGTWTKPAAASFIEFILVGAGGGGGSGRASNGTAAYGGGGGSPGAVLQGRLPAVYFDATEAVTIGIGGTGGTGVAKINDGNNGTNGGNTTVGTSKLLAQGGAFGAKGTASGTGAAGAARSNVILNGNIAQSATSTTGGAANTTANFIHPTGGGQGGGYDGASLVQPTAGGAITATAVTTGLVTGAAGGTAGSSSNSAGASTAGGNGNSIGYFGTGGGGGGGGWDSATGGISTAYGSGGAGSGGAYVGNTANGRDGTNGLVVMITYFD